MTTSQNQIILAKEAITNLKIVGLSMAISLAVYILLFFIKYPDYYTDNDIEKRKQNHVEYTYTYDSDSLSRNFSNKRPNSLSTNISSRKSEYFNGAGGNAAVGEEGMNKLAEGYFLNDIRTKSINTLIYLIPFLITGRYLLLGYLWAKRASKE